MSHPLVLSRLKQTRDQLLKNSSVNMDRAVRFLDESVALRETATKEREEYEQTCELIKFLESQQ